MDGSVTLKIKIQDQRYLNLLKRSHGTVQAQ